MKLIQKSIISLVFFNAIIISCCFATNAYSQKTTPDSLLISYQHSNSDSAELESLRQIINFWKEDMSDSTIFYSKKLIQKAVSCNQIRKAYKGYYWLTNSFSMKFQNDSTLYYAFEGLELFQKHQLNYAQSVMLLLIGEEYRAMRQFDQSEKYLLSAWEIANSIERKESLVGIANRIAATYLENQQHDFAMQWALTSLRKADSLQVENYVQNNYIIIAAVLREQGKYEEAIEAINKALKSDDISDYNKIELLNNLAATYIKLKDSENVIKYANESYQISNSLDLPSYSIVSSEFLATAYSKTNNYKKAYEFARIYERLRHQLFYKERDDQISELHMKYESDRKEMMIQQQESDLRQKEWEIQIRNLSLLLIISISTILLVLIINLFLTRKKLKRANFELIERNQQVYLQKKEIEKKVLELEKANTKLTELDHQKQMFVSMLVHDLKTPLNLLVNLHVFEDENERKALVNRSSKQMLNMVMNMLDVTASEERDLKISKEKIYLLDVLHSAIQDVDFLCISRNIEIKYFTNKDYSFDADPDIFQRMLVNFLTNAIKFSPKNSEIQIIAEDGNHLKLTIKDFGPGIDIKEQKQLFKIFSQLKQPKSTLKGSTGLGLAFCRIAADAHQWEIGVDSRLGEGAEFWLKINEYERLEKTS